MNVLKSFYAKETKDIIKPFVKYTNAGILIPKSHEIKYSKSMEWNW